MTDNLPATQKGQAVTQRPETASLMEAIVKLTSSPQFNPEGIERMMAMYERIKDREAQAAFNEAMAAAQQEMRSVSTDAYNPNTRSNYATYHALDKALRPIYTKHGIALSFNTAPAQRDIDICVICYVTCGGYVREYSIVMAADGKGAKGGEVMTRTHATGSAATYGMRYLLKMIFNVAIGSDGTDDDGNAAGRKAPRPPRPTESQFITPAQVAELRAMLDNSPEREKRFCDRAMWDGAALEGLNAAYFERAKDLILATNAKIARAAPQGPAGWVSVPGGASLPPKPQNSPTGKSGTDEPRSAELRPGDIDYGPLGANLGRSTGISRGTDGFDPETGEVTEPDRPTTRPRPMPPRPTTGRSAQSADTPSQSPPSSSSRTPAGNTAAAVTTGKSSDDNGMPWQLRIVPVIEHAPDFGTATLPELLHYQNELFKIAESPEQAAEIFAHHIRDHYRKLPWPPQADTLKGTWDKMVEERLR